MTRKATRQRDKIADALFCLYTMHLFLLPFSFLLCSSSWGMNNSVTLEHVSAILFHLGLLAKSACMTRSQQQHHHHHHHESVVHEGDESSRLPLSPRLPPNRFG